jgi:bifunctional non-homologous end joining protein LigD
LAAFQAAERRGLEGIVSKRPESRYMSGERSKLWLKAKTFTTSTFELVGVETSTIGIPIALLADGERYVGNAMITLGGKNCDAFWKRIDALGSPRSRLSALHKREKAKWVKPGLVATVRHLRGEQKLRHAVILRIGRDPSRRSREQHREER